MDRADAVHIPGVELHEGLPTITLTMLDVGVTTVSSKPVSLCATATSSARNS
jgi:hypothetical protein